MITLENVTKSYDHKVVLESINLQLDKGHVYGLVGPNGSGKSTLLRLLTGVLKPNTGSISIDGQPVYDDPTSKGKIFFLGDEPYFFAQSTIEDMKTFYKLFYPNFDETLYEELLKEFKLNPKVKINSFSKGMKRQVVIILALASKPEILLLDEAFDGLDPIMRFKLRQYISQEISDRDAIIIISSHNLRELEDICDNILMINQNQLQINHSTTEAHDIYHKYQMVFDEAFDSEKLKTLDPLNISGKERIFTVILKGDKKVLDEKIKALNPMISEHNSVSLEEIFVYEMERANHES